MESAIELETGTEELRCSLADGVATLTLNRPQARNALSDTLSPALRTMIAALADDDRARCVVVTGAGNAFCAGGDVKGMGAGAERSAPKPSRAEVVAELARRQQTLTGALYALPKPTLAVLPGPAAGAGFSIALACDLRWMADSAFVTTGFRNVGLAGDYGASFFLTHLVGTAKARELFYTGERVDAARCLELGIANRVLPAAELRDAAHAYARELANGPTVAFALMKQNLDRALREDLAACLAAEAEATVASASTEDHREAVEAFVQKRAPRFRGR